MGILSMCRLDAALNADIRAIKEYIDAQNYGHSDERNSQHYYENKITNLSTTKAIQRIRCANAIYDTIREGWGSNHCFTHATEMNEMYASCVSGVGSGVLISIKPNNDSFKFIPYITMVCCTITIYSEIHIKRGKKGREPGGLFGEFIVNDNNYARLFSLEKQMSKQKKYTLKFHYIVYPDWVADFFVYIYMWGNIYMSILARKLFGHSCDSNNLYVNFY